MSEAAPIVTSTKRTTEPDRLPDERELNAHADKNAALLVGLPLHAKHFGRAYFPVHAGSKKTPDTELNR